MIVDIYDKLSCKLQEAEKVDDSTPETNGSGDQQKASSGNTKGPSDTKLIGGKKKTSSQDSEGYGTSEKGTDFGKDILIPIGLADDKAFRILHSVIRQMSDGIWENSPTVAKYWKYVDVVVDSSNGVCLSITSPKYWENGFRGKTVFEVKKYFAEKIKQLCKKYIEDSGLGEWDRTNTVRVLYLGDDISIRDAFRVYDSLLGITDKIYEAYVPSDRALSEALFVVTSADRLVPVGDEGYHTVADVKVAANSIISGFLSGKTPISVLETDFSDKDMVSVRVGSPNKSYWVDVSGDVFERPVVTWTKEFFGDSFDEVVDKYVQSSEDLLEKFSDVVTQYLTSTMEDYSSTVL